MKHQPFLPLLLVLALALSACGKSDLLGPPPTSDSGTDLDGDSGTDSDVDADTDTGTGEEVVCGWSEVDVGVDDSELDVEWSNVWGTSPDDVWVTGHRHDSYFYYEPTVAHFNGDAWNVTHVDVSPGYGLTAAWSSSPSNVYSTTCSASTWNPDVEGFLLHFDATTWTQIDVGLTFVTCIGAIWGLSADDLYVAGTVEPVEGEYRDMVHFDGSEWSVVDEFVHGAVFDFWGVEGSHLFGVGRDGRVVHFDGDTWSVMETPTDEDLWTVWASSPTDVFVAAYFVESTEEALVLHYDGEEWSEMEVSEPLRSVRGIWGLASDDVYLAGVWCDEEEGTYWNKILHYDGDGWSEFYSAEQIPDLYGSLSAIWGSSATDIYVVGGRDLVLHYTCE